MDFKEFFTEATEYEKDVKATLKKLPKSHQALVAGYKFKFQPGNALRGDSGHVGILNPKNKTLTIAAPWNYPREFTFLHEIAHQLWELLNSDKQKEWKAIVKRTKEKQKQSAEELFCMAYANTYANNQITIHDHPEWEKFIKALPK